MRAGVSKSNLLYYFVNKEELYVCVLRDLLQVWLAPLREFSAEQDPQRVIGDYIRRKLAVSRDSPEASRLFCLEMIQGAPLLRDELGRELRDLVEQKSAVIQAWVDAGRLAPVNPQHLPSRCDRTVYRRAPATTPKTYRGPGAVPTP